MSQPQTAEKYFRKTKSSRFRKCRGLCQFDIVRLVIVRHYKLNVSNYTCIGKQTFVSKGILVYEARVCRLSNSVNPNYRKNYLILITQLLKCKQLKYNN